MLRILFLVASSFALAAAIQFTDCATNTSNTVLTVHELDLSPSPIKFPGEVHATINLTVNQQITELYLDTVLEKNTLGIWTKVPCVANIGTCTDIDSCTILDRILNGSSIISQDLGQQIDAILLSALGHNAQCPINPENVFIDNETLKLQKMPTALSFLTKGTYRVRISVKEDPKQTDNVGCIEFMAELDIGQETTTAAPTVPIPGVG
ncbi:ganglioside GM2 activator-like [Mercenaria mercenaria]|uniref:ganglioside GM2 activator-like n=1 Tax=Mercenaria mercenaria TaxID=6596 RepID=UPI00234F0DE7|nr:ganglioside GM2 activator-like [Mercenaria mercenaria]